ncbi:hypothetical protein mRhiFer1_009788 [Rhinolophus ferrumequinum]|uniref:Uncharacterized protein n=1 Tax=Rhinolophus ferrumequinum TaxID=59479 RepID=A0A7J7ZCZ5_RHIFE|nr:hypothetical protein mRhiFer1_009788 [Rhinolophus ferrumequinum]
MMGAGRKRGPPPRRGGSARAGRFSGHKGGAPRGAVAMATQSHTAGQPARVAGGCAADGGLRCGRCGSHHLPTPAVPHLRLRLCRLPASPPNSVPELLTEKRDLSQGMFSRWSCGLQRKNPAASCGYPASKPRCGDTRHRFPVVLGPSKQLRGLLGTDTNK